jgi:hypothetical protein
MIEDVQVVSNHSNSTDDAERRHSSPLDLDTTLKKSLGKSVEFGRNCGSAARRNWGLEYPERSGPGAIESRMVSPTQSRGLRFTIGARRGALRGLGQQQGFVRNGLPVPNDNSQGSHDVRRRYDVPSNEAVRRRPSCSFWIDPESKAKHASSVMHADDVEFIDDNDVVTVRSDDQDIWVDDVLPGDGRQINTCRDDASLVSSRGRCIWSYGGEEFLDETRADVHQDWNDHSEDSVPARREVEESDDPLGNETLRKRIDSVHVMSSHLPMRGRSMRDEGVLGPAHECHQYCIKGDEHLNVERGYGFMNTQRTRFDVTNPDGQYYNTQGCSDSPFCRQATATLGRGDSLQQDNRFAAFEARELYNGECDMPGLVNEPISSVGNAHREERHIVPPSSFRNASESSHVVTRGYGRDQPTVFSNQRQTMVSWDRDATDEMYVNDINQACNRKAEGHARLKRQEMHDEIRRGSISTGQHANSCEDDYDGASGNIDRRSYRMKSSTKGARQLRQDVRMAASHAGASTLERGRVPKAEVVRTTNQPRETGSKENRRSNRLAQRSGADGPPSGGDSDDSSDRDARRSHRGGRRDERNRRSRDHNSSHDEDDSSRSPSRSHSRDDKRKNSSRWMKPEKFYGKSSFESFIYQFENCASYNNWKERDKVAHLRWALTDGR